MKKCAHEWIDKKDFLEQLERMPYILSCTKNRTIHLRLKCWRCGYIKNIKMDIFEEGSENFLLDYKFR